MNQQRSRRFRSAREAIEKRAAEDEQLRQSSSVSEDDIRARHKAFDSNAITPGTHFMADLAIALRYYIISRLNTNPGWRNIQVFLSDASVPGEGEHKIMAYIRWLRTQPGYDANTRHCLYGADADLMLLGLMSYEPHLVVLREVFRRGPKRHDAGDRKGYAVVHLNVLRDYFAVEFAPTIDAVQQDLGAPALAFPVHRLVDDLAALSCLVGNDFLPNFPSLYIPHNSIDAIWRAYGAALYAAPGRFILQPDGSIDCAQLHAVLVTLAAQEESFFRGDTERAPGEDGSLGDAFGRRRPRAQQGTSRHGNRDKRQFAEAKLLQQQQAEQHAKTQLTRSQSILWTLLRNFAYSASTALRLPAATSPADRQWVRELAEQLNLAVSEVPTAIRGETCLLLAKDDVDDDFAFGALGVYEVFEQFEPIAEIKDDWALQYYLSKFGAHEVASDEERARVGCEWLKGFHWVLRYYRQRVPSWTWSYTHHYAPLLRDAARACLLLQQPQGQGFLAFDNDSGGPLLPFEQLLSVLPSQSSALIPEPLRPLMLDAGSPVIDYYPRHFGTDLNGKINSYEAVVLIPFADTAVLRKAMAPLMDKIDPADAARNTRGRTYYVTHNPHGHVPAPDDVVEDLERVPFLAIDVTMVDQDYEADRPVYGPLPAAKTGQQGPEQMGALSSVLRLRGKPMHVGVTLFGRPSSNVSVALTVPPSPFDSAQDAQAGRKAVQFYYERMKGYARGFWPCLEHVRIVALSDAHGIYFTSPRMLTDGVRVVTSFMQLSPNSGDECEMFVCFREHTRQSVDEWRASMTHLQKHATKRDGLFLPQDMSVLAHVQRLATVPGVAPALPPVPAPAENLDDGDLDGGLGRLPLLRDNLDEEERRGEETEVEEDNTVLGVPMKLTMPASESCIEVVLGNTFAQPLALLFPPTWSERALTAAEYATLRRASLSQNAPKPRFNKLAAVDARSRWSTRWLGARVLSAAAELDEYTEQSVAAYAVVFSQGLWLEYHVGEDRIRPGTQLANAGATVVTTAELDRATGQDTIMPARTKPTLVSPTPAAPAAVPVPQPTQPTQPLPASAAIECKELPPTSVVRPWTFSEYTGLLVNSASEARLLRLNAQNAYDCPLLCQQGPFLSKVRLLRHLNKVHANDVYPPPDATPPLPMPQQQQQASPSPQSPTRMGGRPPARISGSGSTTAPSGPGASSTSASARAGMPEEFVFPKSYAQQHARAILLRHRRPPNESFAICPFDTMHMVPFKSMTRHLSNAHFNESKIW
eukprot:Unigene11606_Nuclearia_a/m.35361 Unigene11606_Nuclearia_a/g.35361  ORF Unigene11606_Nuclearia_a/g.35361 Unigene11606_Nuclearia_a/m.35361 type:complete len:1264 (-) Unigene11606_Nuclearia_a:602-4393(-)